MLYIKINALHNPVSECSRVPDVNNIYKTFRLRKIYITCIYHHFTQLFQPSVDQPYWPLYNVLVKNEVNVTVYSPGQNDRHSYE